jgi:hypothetical protein
MNTNWGFFVSNVEHYRERRTKIKDAFFKSVQYHSGINLEDNILAGHDIGSGGLITTL